MNVAELNVEEIFVQLFVLARLPTEMSPSQHRRVPITYVGGGSAKLKKGVSLDGDTTGAPRGPPPPRGPRAAPRPPAVALGRHSFVDSSATRAAQSRPMSDARAIVDIKLHSLCCPMDVADHPASVTTTRPQVSMILLSTCRRPSIRTDLLLLQTRSRAGAAGSGGGLGGFRATSGSDKEIHLIRKDSGRCLVQ